MHGSFTMFTKYLHYLLTASNGQGHGIHSPFVYDFIRNVLIDKKHYPAYNIAEQQRRKLLHNHTFIEIQDFGAGSRINPNKSRKVADIAKRSVKPAKFGKLLYRLAGYYNYKNILELGTSLGVTTSYIANSAKDTRILTLEGADTIADLAEEYFKSSGFDNIKLIRGNFDHTLSAAIASMPSIDLAFIDGNHRYEPTITYISTIWPHLNEFSCLILDDIHWSTEMEKVWEDVKKVPEATLTIDLFFLGLVFFRNDFYQKQHFTIRF